VTAFGIDFGTTNSVLASANGAEVETIALDDPPGEWARLGFDKVLPTVIAEAPDGGVQFGWRAKGTDGHLAAVKRLFATDDEVSVGSRRMRVEEAAGIFFRQIKARGSDSGLTVDQAVVTIPANSRGVARFRTKVSAGLSGIEVLALLNEPTAAAMAYSRSIADGERVIVFDWGGGTLDVTILKSVGGVFIEEASKGIQRLGGIDLDDAFLRAVRARLPSHSALDRSDIELAKVELSSRDHWTILPRGGGREMTVSRGELEDAIRPLVVRVRDPIEKCLADLGDPRIDHLALVGGSSKIPMVQRYVQEMLRTGAMEGVDPMTAVAEGAALAAAILTGEVTDFDFFVGTEHALGVLVNDDQGVDRFSTLIPRNTKLPASATDGYVPKFDNQEQVLIRVIEGDPELSVEHEDNVILKHWEVQLDPKPVAEAAFTITFEYDVDGILHVRTVDQATGRVMMNEELTFGAATSKEELVEIRRRIDATRAAGDPATDGRASGPNDPARGSLRDASRLTVRKAREKVYPFVDDATQGTIDGQIAALLEAAGEDEESTARDDLERTLRQHAYLL
jgi:molecular chaperone DnaK